MTLKLKDESDNITEETICIKENHVNENCKYYKYLEPNEY